MLHLNILAAIDSWLFLLFLAIAAILRLLTKAAGSKSDSNQPDESTFPKPDQSAQPMRPGSDEDQIRKFLEALGQPRTAKPPAPVAPRTNVPPRPVAPVRPPQTMVPLPPRRTMVSGERTPQQPPRRETVSPALPRPYQPKKAAPTAAPEPVFEVREATTPLPDVIPTSKAPTQMPATDQPQEISVVGLLRTARGMRDAVILREILGPPRGMQPFEFSGAA